MRSRRGAGQHSRGNDGWRWRAHRLWGAGAVMASLAFMPRSALAADLDADELDDAWELSYFGDLGSGATGDPDGDGLGNEEEESFGSSPTLFDTDGDALSDLREKALGSSPTRRDTDSDGLSDYAETQVHETNPRRKDSDGGGRGDGEEVLIDGTNPRQSSDDFLDSD